MASSVFALLFVIIALLLLIAYLVYVSLPGQKGPVYLPTPHRTVRMMMDLSGLGPRDTLIDLGSGDGRILIAAAKRGAKAIGYEIDPLLAMQSRQKIKKAGLAHLARVEFKSFWRADFEKATVISTYLFPRYMDRLLLILEKRLEKPLRLVSHDYPFTGKKYDKKRGKVYLYLFS